MTAMIAATAVTVLTGTATEIGRGTETESETVDARGRRAIEETGGRKAT